MSKNRLDEEKFSYSVTREGSLFVYWQGKHVRTYSGHTAAEIIEELETAQDGRDVQYTLARFTGNFKRGNEKNWKRP